MNEKPSAAQDEAAYSPHRDVESVRDLTERNIALIGELEAVAKAKRSFTDRVVDQITCFCGNVAFIWAHLALFTIWIVLNLTHVTHFDHYPFSLLTLVVALEAIFLVSFILISDNRQARLLERRGHLDLQINLLSEQENTKILTMLLAIQEHLGIEDNKRDTSVLLEAAEPASMIQQIEQMMEDEDGGSVSTTV